jgi:DNA-binding transcriptional LysR family regulator
MEIRNLISFKKICEYGSFTKAAAELGYSQSTVTMQMKQLETELEVSLFDRIGKVIQLTEDGRRFLSYANEIILTANNARQALNKSCVPKGEIKLGLLESVCTAYLPGILKAFHSSCPEVSTVIKIGTFQELAAMLAANTIDLLWTFDLPLVRNDWNKVCSYKSEICIVASPDHKLAASEHIFLKDMKSETLILTEQNCSYRTIFERRLKDLDIKPNIFLEIGNTEIIKKFVEANLGIAVLPEFAITEELKNGIIVRLDVADFKFEMEGQLLIHKNKWLTPGLQAFIELVKGRLY